MLTLLYINQTMKSKRIVQIEWLDEEGGRDFNLYLVPDATREFQIIPN